MTACAQHVLDSDLCTTHGAPFGPRSRCAAAPRRSHAVEVDVLCNGGRVRFRMVHDDSIASREVLPATMARYVEDHLRRHLTSPAHDDTCASSPADPIGAALVGRTPEQLREQLVAGVQHALDRARAGVDDGERWPLGLVALFNRRFPDRAITRDDVARR